MLVAKGDPPICLSRHPRPPRPPPQHPRETKRLRGRRDGWQLNVINAHVPFGNATESFPQALAEAYRQMAMVARTIIIGDIIAAPTPAESRRASHNPGPCRNAGARAHDG